MSALMSLLELPTSEQETRGLLFTPREIAQQPTTWRTTLSIFERDQDRIRLFLEQAGVTAVLEQRPIVMLVGAGTSDYIGLALALLLRQCWGCETSAVASTDLLTNLSDYVVPGRRYLWISFSRSGDSPEGLNVLEQAIENHPEIFHLIVTCNPRARMIAAGAGHMRVCTAILDDSVNDRSLAMTSSFTNMVVFGQCLAHTWSLGDYKPILDLMITAATPLLDVAAEVAMLASQRGSRQVYMIGSGALAAIAKEASLKVLEMSGGQVKTISHSSLGLRHGPMAGLDRNTDLVCFLSSQRPRIQYEIDLLREIQRKQITACCTVIGLESDREIAAPVCDTFLPIQGSFADIYRPPVDVIFGQILGLYCSMSLGLRPDAPSPQGVISRVVSDFTIYH